MNDLTPEQSAILALVAKLAKLAADFDIRNFSFEPDIDDYYHVASARMPTGGEPVHVVIGLPLHGDHVFIAISDGDPVAIAKAVGSLQHYDERKARLHMGDTVPLTAVDEIKNAGWAAALFCPIEFLLDEFPASAEIHDKHYCFQLAVLINSAERKFKIDNGFDKLMELFEAENRDIVSFYQ